MIHPVRAIFPHSGVGFSRAVVKVWLNHEQQ
jgi:hypothetical protein